MKNQKKIGILTFHRAYNYGAVWQCWALKHVCEELGYNVEIIDYNPFGCYSIKNALRHRPYVAYRYLAHMHIFSQFVKKQLNPTPYTESKDWIAKNPPKDDIYIVGSDMVWSKEIVGSVLDSYLLDFAPAHVRRVAYAASTGGSLLKLSEKQLEELQKFSAISVRESQTIQNVQEKVSIPVSDVCDPTLILKQEDYEPYEKKIFGLPARYVAYFNLAGDPFCEKSTRLISETLGLPVVNMVGKYGYWAKRNYPAPNLSQWLYILHHAEFVCTNSFHGVCFSIIYNRPFVYCEAQVRGHNKHTGRIQNLLEHAHLQNRYVTDIEQVTKIAMGGG